MNSLPSEIIACILSRLPIRTILICKQVCNRWLDILSAPEFANCHLSLSNPGLITHQFEEEDLWKVIEFDDVLELQSHDLHYNLVNKFDPRSFITSPDARIVIEGSVNGFLFLRDFSSTQLDSLYICNPITREYIALPQPEFIVQNAYNSHYGFGLSSVSGKYKVVWNNYHETRSFSDLPRNSDECLVYTLGTGSWRSVALGGPIQTLRSSIGVFLNGNLHWLAQDFHGYHMISCFDLETEIFKPFSLSLPPYPRIFPDSRSLVVLQDCLCLCEYSKWDTIVIWMMKENQLVNESWSQQYAIPITFQTTCETMYPIKVFKDGDILILWEDFELFFYSNKSKSTRRVGAFEMVHYSGWTEATLHTSSFVSLKRFCAENVGIF